MLLSEIRKQIDAIDSQLLPLFVERMRCAEQVARNKMEQNLPIFNEQRENQILDKVGSNAGDFDTEAKMLYTVMMSLSRMRQHKMMHSGTAAREKIESALQNSAPLDGLTKGKTVACVGSGSYANEAAVTLFPDREIHFQSSHNEVFHALEQGSSDIGILPVENSSAGSVAEVYDLIMQYRFSIIAATTVQVRHCLAAPRGATLKTLHTVTSHPQALSQCSEFIRENGYQPIQYANTALAAKKIAEINDCTCGVVCSELAAEQYGLQILQKNIQNNMHNRTRFVAIKKELSIPKEADKISLCFSLDHKTGSLYSVLGRFAMHGLNLTKIESRPARAAVSDLDDFQYDFYLDFSGSVSDEKTLDLICELSSELNNFSFLGNYVEK
ncbi:MAG: prephenate dehydratase domain-containing protein [Oscillospiraceae bacterium]|nr:prephenate dehydratase domain-containing protein [Oscillospiraceae bacterium]